MKPPPTSRDPNRKVRASLIDRLIDEEPGNKPERPPLRVQSRNQFARSLMRDLGWLLNTRCGEKKPVGKEAGPRTVLDYGVEDLTHLAPASYDDRQVMAKRIRDAITAFEPRLQVTRLTVEPVEGKHREVEVRVEAWLWTDEVREPVSFRVMLDLADGEAEVRGS
ncbi:MAG: type VI secretion system baseplate subunit TssE [Myxococcales bacterium]|nr:type VI secretion system baseplate subunit TssE [Myxococcales bacterium]